MTEINMTILKLRQIIEAKSDITALSDRKLQGYTAFKLAPVIKKLVLEIDNFEEIKNNLIVDLGVLKNESTYELLPENLEKFKTEIDRILDEDVSIENLKKVKSSEIFNDLVEVRSLFQLSWLFDCNLENVEESTTTYRNMFDVGSINAFELIFNMNLKTDICNKILLIYDVFMKESVDFKVKLRDLVLDLGKKNESTGQYDIPVENQVKYDKLKKELLNTTININVAKLSAEDINTFDSVNIDTLMQLTWCITDN